MGGQDFTHYEPGTSVKACYDKAVADAVHEHGTDWYNGTISTTCGYYEAVHAPMTRSGADVWTGAYDIEKLEKGGAALAIPIAKDDQFTFTTHKHTITLDLTDKRIAEELQYGRPEWLLTERGQRAAVTSYLGSVHKVEVKPHVKTAIKVETAQGRATTEYEINAGYRRQFKTKPEAVAAAKKIVAEGQYAAITIKAVKVYPDGADAVKVSRGVIEAKAEVIVTVAKPKQYSTPIAGWLFFGMAST